MSTETDNDTHKGAPQKRLRLVIDMIVPNGGWITLSALDGGGNEISLPEPETLAAALRHVADSFDSHVLRRTVDPDDLVLASLDDEDEDEDEDEEEEEEDEDHG